MGCGASKSSVEVSYVPRQQLQLQPQRWAPAAVFVEAQQHQSDVAHIEALVHEIEELLGSENIEDKYEFAHEIAHGSFGRIFAATLIDDPTQRRAIKALEHEDGGEHLFFREVKSLKKLSHEHIVSFYDVFDDPDFLYVVMEICDGGDLFTQLQERERFSETDAAQLGGQMLLALRYIHSRHIAHRDVKAENFMLATPHGPFKLKLVDFNLACKFTPGGFMVEVCGSVHYLAPELIGRQYNFLVDIWAFGVLQFLLMHGRYPYNGKTPHDIMMKITCATKLWRAQAHVSLTCMDFLQGILAVRASSRFSAQEALEHVWMHATDVDTPSERNPVAQAQTA